MREILHPAPSVLGRSVELDEQTPNDGQKANAMNSMITNDLVFPFKEWCRQTCKNHHEVLLQMQKSSDILDRIISRRILLVGEGGWE